MTAAAELLARCRTAGITLRTGESGALEWEADADLSAELLADLAANKAAVRRLLTRPAVPPWDAAAADALLAELRGEVARVVEAFDGRPPAPLAVLLADAITIGERFVLEHEREEADRWDALALLADLPPMVRDYLASWPAPCEARRPLSWGAFIDLRRGT